MYDVIIVGGSAAGLTAALYTSRQGMKTLVITKDIGGQMLLTNEIQNYPGFQSISGFELATRFKEQAESYGTEFVYEEVVSVEEDKECPGLCFRVKTSQDVYNSLSVILAFGKTPRDLGVPGEMELKGKGVSYCAVCDGPLFKGKRVSVVGSGEQALDAVNYLSSIAETVYFIHNYDKPIGSEELVEQIISLPNVKRVPNSRVKELVGDTRLKKVIVVNTKDGSLNEIESDAIFIEIGYIAKTEFLNGFVDLNSKGEIKVDKECKTSHTGVFAAGDVTDISFKQAVISAAEGAVAALSAYNYVQRVKGKTAVRSDWRTIQPRKKSESSVKI
jgi:thioredoxin reductase (NADPH)